MPKITLVPLDGSPLAEAALTLAALLARTFQARLEVFHGQWRRDSPPRPAAAGGGPAG